MDRIRVRRKGRQIPWKTSSTDCLPRTAHRALAGIKPANLVSCDRTIYPDLPEQLETYREAFAPRGMRFEIVCACRARYLLLVYNEAQLERYMQDERVQHVLRRFGYPVGSPLPELLAVLRKRIACTDGFPHEIGLFLGYPIEDVVGFIRYSGRGCKLTATGRFTVTQKRRLVCLTAYRGYVTQ